MRHAIWGLFLGIRQGTKEIVKLQLLASLEFPTFARVALFAVSEKHMAFAIPRGALSPDL